MLTHPTLSKLREMKLDGMAQALQEQLTLNNVSDLSFEERLALLIDVEMTYRDNKRYSRKLKNAKLRQQASLEDIDYRHPRNLDRSLMQSLASCVWVKERHNLIITGPTGVGKTYLACALAHSVKLDERSGMSQRLHRLLRSDLAFIAGTNDHERRRTLSQDAR